jgi:ornithine cyclodeaminase/alanine dehydrogenase-like protein (mu-crystallin family)
VLVLTEKHIESLLSLNQIVDAVEASIKDYENQIALVLKRMHIDRGKNSMLCMPSWGKDFLGTKLVTVAPGNATKKLPVIFGAMTLNDASTGKLLALINGSKLTAIRTGALGAVGLRYITPANIDSIGLIGCGMQGLHQAIFAPAVRPIKKIFYLHRSDDSATKLKSIVKKYWPAVEVVPCTNAQELLAKTQTIITATSSAKPILPNNKKLLEGKHFVAIGSYRPSMQELPDKVYELAGMLSIDSEFARHETGDILNPLKKKIIAKKNVYALGKLITGKKRIDVNKTTVFKSTGMALFDLYVAQAIYEAAVKKKVGNEVEF